MNNQAAQTMPEPVTASVLADLIDWHKRDGTKKGKLTTQALQELAEYRTRAAALSQTAGVVVSDEMIERACKKYAFREDGAVWPDAYSEHEVAAERTLMREFLEHVLAAAPAASGVDTSTNEAWAARAQEKITAMDAASVSERARGYHQHDAIEFAGALRDAERYRWLKCNCQHMPDELGIAGQLYFGTYAWGDLDTAIDSAMQQGGGGGE